MVIITSCCAPSKTCSICKAGRRRFGEVNTEANGARTFRYTHVGGSFDAGDCNTVLCEDQSSA